MKVTLINYTANAVNMLLFANNTRLGLTPAQMERIEAMTEQEKMDALTYMANTVPSAWEFVDYTFLVSGVSRAFTHQCVRTRTASYAQQSMRITDMSKGFEFVNPESFDQLNPTGKQVIEAHLKETMENYKFLSQMGIPLEDCRSILPTNTATNILIKHNLRSFSDLVKTRIGGRAQTEYRRAANAMVDAVLAVHPWAEKFIFGQRDRHYYDDIEDFARALQDPDKTVLLKIVHQMRKAGA